MTTFRKALTLMALLAALAGLPLAAQGTDCAFTFSFTGDATQTAVSNLSGQTPCVNWRITYSVTGTLTSTVTFQVSPTSAPGDFVSVPNTPCSSTQQPPCVIQGTNPLTGTTYGMAYFSSYGAYVRVITTGSGGAGTGTIRGYGAKGATASAGGSGGGGGTVTDTLGPLTLNAVILGNGTNDVKPGSVLPNDATKFYDGKGNFSPIPLAGSLTYYATNTASSIATYLQQTQTPFSPKTTLTFAGLAAGTDTLQNWATNAGIPNLTFIPAGVFTWHIHGLRTGATGTVKLRGQFWEVNAAGVDIAQIGTDTEDSVNLGTLEAEYQLQMATANTYTMASASSRIVLRAFAVVTGGSTPDVHLFVGGTADSHISLPAATVDVTNFVPYIGATATVDLATHDLVTGTGNGGFGVDARTGNTTPLTKLVAWGGNIVVGDPAVLGAESLTNGALTSGTSWSVTGDFALAANAATYTDSTHVGTLVQASGTLAVAGVGNRWYKFIYDVSAVSPGMTACTITTLFSDNAFGISFDITAGTGKIFYFKSTTAPGNFVISCTSTAGGALTLDNLSLKEVQGGNVVVYGMLTGGGTSGIKISSSGLVTIAPGPLSVDGLGTAGTINFNSNDGTLFERLSFNESGIQKAVVQRLNSAFSVTARQQALEFINSSTTGAVSFWTNNLDRLHINADGTIGIGIGLYALGAFPTITGCGTISATAGGATAGTFATNTTGTCAAVIPLPTAPNGWTCYVQNLTKHIAANIMIQSASAANSCTVTGTTASGDVLNFLAIGF